jgi:DNA transformation protein
MESPGPVKVGRQSRRAERGVRQSFRRFPFSAPGNRFILPAMTASKDFMEHAAELFAPLGPIAVRRMFGGAGIYCRGIMFALIADDVIYLKADAETRGDFEAKGVGPFIYSAKGKPISMSYWQLPPELLDQPDDLLEWARKALGVARKQKAEAPPPSRRPPGPSRRWR